MLFFFSSEIVFVCDKVAASPFKYAIILTLKSKNSLKFDQDTASDYVRDKEKHDAKVSYKLFEDKYGYDTLLNIYPFQTLFQLKNFLGGIQFFFTVVGK